MPPSHNQKLRDYKVPYNGTNATVAVILESDGEEHIAVILRDLRKGEFRWTFSPDFQPETIQYGTGNIKDGVSGKADKHQYGFRFSHGKIFSCLQKKGEAVSDETEISPAALKNKNDSNLHSFRTAIDIVKMVPALREELGEKIDQAYALIGHSPAVGR